MAKKSRKSAEEPDLLTLLLQTMELSETHRKREPRRTPEERLALARAFLGHFAGVPMDNSLDGREEDLTPTGDGTDEPSRDPKRRRGRRRQ
jgi:hypothetical protein